MYVPLYGRKSFEIIERSSFHQAVKSIFDFYYIILRELILRSESAVNRNGGKFGTKQCPDVKTSKNHQTHEWEFMFCEISYGPYSFDETHYLEDETRLGKFAKDLTTWL